MNESFNQEGYIMSRSIVRRRLIRTCSIAALGFAAMPSIADAQTVAASPPSAVPETAAPEPGEPQVASVLQAEEPAPGEDIVITGSRIRRQSQLPSPVLSIGGADLAANGVKDIRDLIAILPINAGAQNNADNLTQNFTVGTANINLRGLGVAETLVLLNGRRQVLSSVNTDDGSSFVDLSALVPDIAIARVDILKDGASAIYGSDAVAGVANFITRTDLKGLELSAEVRARTNNGTQRDITIDGALGGAFGGGQGSYLVAASYLNRTSLVLGEVDWLTPAYSSTGNPGSFTVPSLRRTVADPGCAANGGFPQALANGNTICRFDYAPQITAVPTEKRIQSYARGSWEFSDAVKVSAEVGYARNDITREVSPSYGILRTLVVPANNPGNVFGQDVLFQGRAYGVGYPNETNFYKHDTLRIALAAEGRFGPDLHYDLSYITARTDSIQNPRDTIVANFQRALQGFGGINCDTSPTARVAAVAGQGNCLFFNPFSSSLTARPGTAQYNDPSLKSYIIGDYIADARSGLDVVEGNLTGAMFALPGGSANFAVGAQYRKQSLRYRYDSITQQDGWGFLLGNRNFDGQQSAVAVYGEVSLPITSWAEIDGAVRYERYADGLGATTNPKVAAIIRPFSTLSLRGSYSTSFRAPSIFQTQGVQTSFVNIIDADRTSAFAGRRVLGDPTLRPEKSRAINIGATWTPLRRIELSADYWSFRFRDVLTIDNAQAIVNANPNDPRILRTESGTISLINVNFINAAALKTSGIDLSARGHFTTDLGDISPFFDGTILTEYQITNAGRTIDGLGKLNRSTVGSPNQRFRGNLGVTWASGPVNATVVGRYTSSYEDDGNVRIDDLLTFDANVGIDLAGMFGSGPETKLTLGVINLTDRNPPFVNVPGSYDSRSADPRGRRAYARVGIKF